jgi:hypothetical protein
MSRKIQKENERCITVALSMPRTIRYTLDEMVKRGSARNRSQIAMDLILEGIDARKRKRGPKDPTITRDGIPMKPLQLPDPNPGQNLK